MHWVVTIAGIGLMGQGQGMLGNAYWTNREKIHSKAASMQKLSPVNYTHYLACLIHVCVCKVCVHAFVSACMQVSEVSICGGCMLFMVHACVRMCYVTRIICENFF